ncbi:MAG: hypothetical protein IJ882_04685, partial [Paludibacteraceae bacterium]|nr:hypothetical protein [Paludibacteraceae bacterium]
MPDTLQFTNGNPIVHDYDAMGNRLRTTYYTRKVALVETDSKPNECLHLQFGAAEVGNASKASVETDSKPNECLHLQETTQKGGQSATQTTTQTTAEIILEAIKNEPTISRSKLAKLCDIS